MRAIGSVRVHQTRRTCLREGIFYARGRRFMCTRGSVRRHQARCTCTRGKIYMGTGDALGTRVGRCSSARGVVYMPAR